MSLLRDDDIKVAKMAEDDDMASRQAFSSEENYFHIEYLDWMGKDVFDNQRDVGDIVCFGCCRSIGKWVWSPSARLTLNGKFEAPLFMIHKNVVHQMDLPFDATPISTPRIDDVVMTTSPRSDTK